MIRTLPNKVAETSIIAPLAREALARIFDVGDIADIEREKLVLACYSARISRHPNLASNDNYFNVSENRSANYAEDYLVYAFDTRELLTAKSTLCRPSEHTLLVELSLRTGENRGFPDDTEGVTTYYIVPTRDRDAAIQALVNKYVTERVTRSLKKIAVSLPSAYADLVHQAACVYAEEASRTVNSSTHPGMDR